MEGRTGGMSDLSNVLKIDLREYFNNKAICDIATITSDGYSSAVSDDMMIVSGSMEYINENYKGFFDFSEIATENNDSFICQGQKIEGAFGNCTQICILGFGQWINFNDIITVIYENGEQEELQFSMPCGEAYERWMTIKQHGLLLSTEYRSLERGISDIAFLAERSNGVQSDKIGVYVSKCILEKCGKIKSIIFPDNEFVIVFAITLV